MKPAEGDAPIFTTSKKMDFELEMAFVVGVGNEMGTKISVEKAKDHIFGIMLMNDWSARDIQAWEYVPLGPFLGKSFGTTISPWIITLDALDEIGANAPGPTQNPPPISYLKESEPRSYDVKLKVFISSNLSSINY